jgi:putative ATP-dependent endonuclease of OLD family
LAKIHQDLQPSPNEMFFTPFLVLVEGLEDVAYIRSHLHLSSRWSEWRRLGCHMVSVGGKSNLIQPLAAAKLLAIPTFVVFDSDAHAPDKNGSRTKHEKDNKALLKLCGYAEVDPLPSTTCWGNGVAMWKSEIGLVVAEDYGEDQWKLLSEQADLKYGHAGGLDKNALHIAEMLESAFNQHGASPTLERLCISLISCAGSGGHTNPENEAAQAAIGSLVAI